jgi:predicted Zn finger-like uncharacterized protein
MRLMDVECPKCGTVFEFDEAQMRSSVATLKCSVCAHMFRIHTDGVHAEQESARRWMVRQREGGDIHYFSGFVDLHHMIMGGKASRRDEISRTGDKWVELGGMGEFVPVFQALESIERLTRGEEVPEVPEVPEAPERELPGPGRDRVRTMQQFPSAANAPMAKSAEVTIPHTPRPRPAPVPAPAPVEEPTRPREVPPRPARVSEPLARQPERPERRSQESEAVVDDKWSLGDMASTTASMTAYEAPVAPRKSRAGLWVALLCVLGLGGAGAYAWVYERDTVMGLLGGGGGAEQVSPGEVTAGVDAPEVGAADEAPEVERSEASRVVEGAVGAAAAVASAEAARAVSGVATRGREEVEGAVDAAARRAKRHAERGDVDVILTNAQRALERGQKEKARALFGRAMEADPGNVAAITGLGWSLMAMGRLDSSVAQFKRALHLNSRYADAFIGLGKAERRRGNLEGALSAYERYLTAYPSGPQASIARHQRDELKRALGK